MGTVKSYPRRELTRLRRQWLGRNKKPVMFAVAFFLVSAAAATWFGLTHSSHASWYAVGLAHATLAAMILHLLNMAVLAHDREAVFQLRGAWGEDSTRSELKTAKRRRLIWGWVDSVSLQAGDLDHVVVTRSGGLVVLDSKFRTELTAAAVADMTASAKRARLRTEALARTVLRSDRSGRHRASTQPVDVTTCIVLWGPARRGVPEGHVVDGVHFVDGTKVRAWLQQLPPSAVSKVAAEDLLRRLAEFRTSAGAASR